MDQGDDVEHFPTRSSNPAPNAPWMLAFKKHADEAVSPVIAVILMVAITVVLAATVWVWVSGFGPTGTPPTPSLALSENSFTTNATTAAASCAAGASWCAKWTVTSVTPNVAWSRLHVTDTTTDVGAITCQLNGATRPPVTTLQAGDVLACSGTSTTPNVGDQLAFSDTASQSVVTTMTLR